MDSNGPGETEKAVTGTAFTTTHCSVVLQASSGDTPEAARALEQLCGTYWYPLYVFVRRRGHFPEDAQDLTQEFFALFLQKGYFHLADPSRGRFRTFLLHALEHFLISEWKRGQRLKRGGGCTIFSLDEKEAELRYLSESVKPMTPERCYERRWAMTLLEQAMSALQQEYLQAGRAQIFQELADLLWGKDPTLSCPQISARLGMTEGAVRVALHRLRQRYREHLRAEVAKTVAEPGDVDQELQHLLNVLSSTGG